MAKNDVNGIPLMAKSDKSIMGDVSAIIKIGSLHINLYNKTFTEEQIKNMREYFGWEVENIKK